MLKKKLSAFAGKRGGGGGVVQPPQPPVRDDEASTQPASAPPFQFNDEDEAAQRDRFERVVAATPMEAFQCFSTYVWREHAGVGLHPEQWVEIVKDSSTPGGMEVGMSRVVAGYREEVTAVLPGRLIEYKVLGEGDAVNACKGRVTFADSGEGKCLVRWTIFWSPSSTLVGLVYAVLIKGYVSLALYQLDARLAGQLVAADDGSDAAAAAAAAAAEDHSVASSTSQEVLEDAAALKAGETPLLQFAARLQTGYEGNLTAQQKAALDEMRELLKSKDVETWALLLKHPDGPDRYMLRFLRAECHGRNRDFNVAKSHKRLAATLRFRRDVGADVLVANPPPFYDLFTSLGAELETMDREGRVVVWTRAGLISTYMDVSALSNDEWIKGMVTITERRFARLRESSKRLGHEVSATVVIYDLSGLGLRSAKILKFAQIINSVASVHYPEAVDSIVLLNAPSVFSTLYAMVQTWLDPVTRSKIKVYAHGKKDRARAEAYLKSFMDDAAIPKEFGGSSDAEVAVPLHAKQAGITLPSSR